MVPFLKEDKNIIHYKKNAWRIQEIPRFVPGRHSGQGGMPPSVEVSSLPS